VALGVVFLLTLAGAGAVSFFSSEAGNLSTLLNKVADSIESWRAALPSFIAEQLPADVDDLLQTEPAAKGKRFDGLCSNAHLGR
jgi:hypothetical protein